MRQRQRMARWWRPNKKLIEFCLVLCVVVTAGLGIGIHTGLKRQNSRHVTASNYVNMGSCYRNLTYQKKKYQYNELVTTVLYAGIDSEGIVKQTAFTDAPRADSIHLAVLDKKNKRMSVIAISRDTMTEIRRYTMTGKDRGTYVSHLGLAYSYGDGGSISCENLREAVSRLLGGIPIDEYVITNRSSLPYINRLVGGVTVTVPNADLEEKNPVFQEGSQVLLDDSNVELFLRWRDTTKVFSNEGRMERQRAYIDSYVGQFQKILKKDLNGVWKKIQSMDQYLQTSITKNKYLELANLMNLTSFESDDYHLLEGTDDQGELYDEFYVDEAALQELVLELFYEEV